MLVCRKWMVGRLTRPPQRIFSCFFVGRTGVAISEGCYRKRRSVSLTPSVSSKFILYGVNACKTGFGFPYTFADKTERFRKLEPESFFLPSRK